MPYFARAALLDLISLLVFESCCLKSPEIDKAGPGSESWHFLAELSSCEVATLALCHPPVTSRSPQNSPPLTSSPASLPPYSFGSLIHLIPPALLLLILPILPLLLLHLLTLILIHIPPPILPLMKNLHIFLLLLLI